MQTIVITGADGFFGSRFIGFFGREFSQGFKVIPLSHHDLDITDYESILVAFQKHSPSIVVHAAAIAATVVCEANPPASLSVNFNGAVNVGLACKHTGAKMIFLSSDQVYSKTGAVGPFSETAPLCPNNVYALHKRDAEDAIIKLLPDAVVLRLTWLFGLPEEGKKTNSNIITNVLNSISTTTPLSIPINEYRGITYIYDLLERFDRLMSLPGGVYNAGSENNLCTYDVVYQVITELLQSKQNCQTKQDIYKLLTKDSYQLLTKDITRFRETPRDLRICTCKLRDFGLSFPTTEQGILKCIKIATT